MALASALLVNTTCHTIDLHGNRIGNEGAAALAKALMSNTTIRTIDLHENQIGNEGLDALVKAMASNSTAHTIYLGENEFDDERTGLAERVIAGRHRRHLGQLQLLLMVVCSSLMNPCSEIFDNRLVGFVGEFFVGCRRIQEE